MRKSATDGYDVTVRHEQYISVNCLRRAISIGERDRADLKSGTLLGWYGWVMDLGWRHPWSWPTYLMFLGSQCLRHLRWLRKRKLKADDNMAIMAMLSALTRPRPLEEEGRMKTKQWCGEKRTQPVRVFNVTMFSGKRKPEWSLLVMRRTVRCYRTIKYNNIGSTLKHYKRWN